MSNAIVNTNQSQGALLPTNIGQAMDLAKMMADSALVPQPLQKKPADCLLVIEQSMRWGMSPFAVAQCASVIKGKLMYEGKLVAAVVNANGNLQERLNYAYMGEGDNRKITVSGLVRGEKEPRTVDVVLKDVKTSNEQWTKQPDQQLMYSGARIWARRHTPELMLGVMSPDEDFEVIDVTPATPIIPQVQEVPANPETGSKEPHNIPVPVLADSSGSDWMAWGKAYSAALRSTTTAVELEEWVAFNADAMVLMSTQAENLFKRLEEIIKTERKKLG